MSLPNKYTKWYCKIIDNALKRSNISEYSENHHILPKSFKCGGEHDPTNLVKLTSKEHFICHRLLPKMVLDKTLRLKMICAVLYMSYGNGKKPSYIPPAWVVQNIRVSLSKLKTGTKGKKWTESQRAKLKNRVPHNKGVPMTEESKANLREKRKKQIIGPRKPETKEKVSKNLKGKTTGRKWWNDGINVVRSIDCPGPKWSQGHLQRTAKGKKWWSNGEKETLSEISPGENWSQGRLLR